MFDVYVDGATGPSREAVRELASAMAARYRLPAAELEARLTRGRFRVKAGVDRATAEAYLRDLAAIGARVRIEPAGPPPSQPPESRPMRSSLAPPPESRPARSSPAPPPESRPMRSSLPPPSEPGPMRPSPSPAPQPESRPAPSLPAQPAQPALHAPRSSLPQQPESRPARSSLPPPSEARPARSSLPPQPESRSARSSLPPPSGPRSSLPPLAGSPPASASPSAGSSGSPGGGGVVAVTGEMATLGALDRSGALSLATLDDEPAQSPATDGVLPASMGPAAPRPERPARSRNEQADPFAPPEQAALADEPLLQLADEDVGHRVRRPASPPPAVAGPPVRTGAPSNPPASVQRASPVTAPDRPLPFPSSGALGAEPGHRAPAATSPGVPQGPATSPAAPPAGVVQRLLPALPAVGPPPQSSGAPVSALGRAARNLGSGLVARLPALGSARVQLVAGIALAIGLGFVPAHLVGGMRERSAFGAIDARIVAVQSTADTPDSYAALDAFRAEQLDAKYSARRSIAVTSLVVWAAVGAALALGWFSLFRPSPAPGVTREVGG